jgi:hypothetical protein
MRWSDGAGRSAVCSVWRCSGGAGRSTGARCSGGERRGRARRGCGRATRSDAAPVIDRGDAEFALDPEPDGLRSRRGVRIWRVLAGDWRGTDRLGRPGAGVPRAQTVIGCPPPATPICAGRSTAPHSRTAWHAAGGPVRSPAGSDWIRLLRAHGLVHKRPKSHRYVVSPKGHRIISALLTAYHFNTDSLNKLAAQNDAAGKSLPAAVAGTPRSRRREVGGGAQVWRGRRAAGAAERRTSIELPSMDLWA